MTIMRRALRYPLKMLRFTSISAAFFCLGIFINLSLSWLFSSENRAAGVSAPELFTWEHDHPNFGGISALILRDTHMLAATDRGYFIEARVKRDATGKIAAINDAKFTQSSLQSGRPPTSFKMDIEALTPLPDGQIAVAFEGFVRFEILKTPQDRPQGTHPWDRYASLFGNWAFEALATLPDGRLFAITEPHITPGFAGTQIYNGTRWTAGPDMPVADQFKITGADVGPDGCLYLVERHVSIFTGLRFRLRRLSGGLAHWQETVLYTSPAGTLRNAEGISVWQSGTQLALSVVTDDGFLPLHATQLIEFKVPPGTCNLEL